MLEQGWNGIEDIQADQFGPFSRLKMSQMLPQGPKLANNSLLATKIDPGCLFWIGRGKQVYNTTGGNREDQFGPFI